MLHLSLPGVLSGVLYLSVIICHAQSHKDDMELWYKTPAKE